MVCRSLLIGAVALVTASCTPVVKAVRNLDPKEAAWDYSDKAKQESRAGDWSAAKSDIEQAISLYPSEPDFHNTYAAILIETDRAAAEREMRKVIGLTEKTNAKLAGAAYTNLALLQINENRYSDAEESGRKAVNLNSEDSHAWNNLGVALLRQHKYDAAAGALKRSLAISPDSETAARNYGDAVHHQSG